MLLPPHDLGVQSPSLRYTAGPVMADAALGTKRKCLSCGAPFFDLRHDPIICPKCEAVFTPIPVPRSPIYKKTRPPIDAPATTVGQAVGDADEKPDGDDREITDDPDDAEPAEEPDDDILPLE